MLTLSLGCHCWGGREEEGRWDRVGVEEKRGGGWGWAKLQNTLKMLETTFGRFNLSFFLLLFC